MKAHIEALRAIQEQVKGRADPATLSNAIERLAGTIAAALADMPAAAPAPAPAAKTISKRKVG